MKIAVIGSINVDMVVLAERIPKKGETVLGKELCFSSGGKGANQAVAMAKLGAEVEMFGCVGADDYGEKMVKNLKNSGVKTDHISVLEKVPTGMAFITIGDNDNTIVVVAGANEKVDRVYVDGIQSYLKGFDMIVMQHEIPFDTVCYVVNLCDEYKIPVLLNPAPAMEVPLDIVEKVTYLTPNEHEAKMIFGDSIPLEELLKRYPEKLVVTRGEKGVSVGLKTGEILNIPACVANVADTTGAGDTLNGAFSKQIASGADIRSALIYANTAAGLSVERMGAQTGMPDDIAVRRKIKDDIGSLPDNLIKQIQF